MFLYDNYKLYEENMLSVDDIFYYNEGIASASRQITAFFTGGHLNIKHIRDEVNDMLPKVKTLEEKERIIEDLDKLEKSLKGSGSLGAMAFKALIVGGLISIIWTAINSANGKKDDLILAIRTIKKEVEDYELPVQRTKKVKEDYDLVNESEDIYSEFDYFL